MPSSNSRDFLIQSSQTIIILLKTTLYLPLKHQCSSLKYSLNSPLSLLAWLVSTMKTILKYFHPNRLFFKLVLQNYCEKQQHPSSKVKQIKHNQSALAAQIKKQNKKRYSSRYNMIKPSQRIFPLDRSINTLF